MLYVYRSTVNMINIQPGPRPFSALTCRNTFSWPNALNPAGRKQNGHVIRGAPCRDRDKESISVCLNEDGAPGLFVFFIPSNRRPHSITNSAIHSSPFMWHMVRKPDFGRERVKGFCETLWNTRLRVWAAPSAFLPHPETTSIRWHWAEKKGLIGLS